MTWLSWSRRQRRCAPRTPARTARPRPTRSALAAAPGPRREARRQGRSCSSGAASRRGGRRPEDLHCVAGEVT